jgi:hypothetical protein
MRSLADLLGIDDIYAQIHRQFSYILKSSARRRIEKVTKGRRAGPLYIQMVRPKKAIDLLFVYSNIDPFPLCKMKERENQANQVPETSTDDGPRWTKQADVLCSALVETPLYSSQAV